MNDRIRELLHWYTGENPGVRANLARLLNHGRLGGTGKLVILPVDQGFEHGTARRFAPNPAGYDPRYHCQLAIEAGCSKGYTEQKSLENDPQKELFASERQRQSPMAKRGMTI